jgi:hypothetical protein
VVATTVNSTLADRWHSICDSFTALNSRGVGEKKNRRKEGVIRQIKAKKKIFFFYF